MTWIYCGRTLKGGHLLLDNQNFIDDDLGSACADSLFSFKNYCNAGEMRIISERLYYYRTNVHEGVVGGLGAKSCPYFLNPVLFARKVSELQKKLGRYAEEFTTYNASQLHYFFNLIHKSNRSKYYDAMRCFWQIILIQKRFLMRNSENGLRM